VNAAFRKLNARQNFPWPRPLNSLFARSYPLQVAGNKADEVISLAACFENCLSQHDVKSRARTQKIINRCDKHLSCNQFLIGYVRSQIVRLILKEGTVNASWWVCLQQLCFCAECATNTSNIIVIASCS